MLELLPYLKMKTIQTEEIIDQFLFYLGFSKILEKIMYSLLYKYLSDNNVLYKKQFGFQEKHSTKHAIMQLVNLIFGKNLYTLGIFIDLSKAFDTVDHKILITKLENYGVKETNLQWFKSYLKNRKQFITCGNFSTSYINISCGVPQGSILVPLLFLVYVICLFSCLLSMTIIIRLNFRSMFADDTNLFYSHQNIETLFGTVNCELEKICEWSRANKLSLKVTKTNYTLFHKNSTKDKLPLKMPELKIGNSIIKGKSSPKFLGVCWMKICLGKIILKRLKKNQPKMFFYYIAQNHILMRLP